MTGCCSLPAADDSRSPDRSRDALDYFGVATVEDIYVTLAEDDPSAWAARWRDTAGAAPAPPSLSARSSLTPRERPGPLRQFTVLTRRTG